MERASFKNLSLGEVTQTCRIRSGSDFYIFPKFMRTRVCLALKKNFFFLVRGSRGKVRIEVIGSKDACKCRAKHLLFGYGQSVSG